MGYKELQIYKRAYKSALAVYKMTKTFPAEERYAIVSQMQRASTSIALNIAEGYARKDSQSDYKRFLTMAIGSVAEMDVLINFSKDLGYITEDQYEKASKEYDEIGRMLNKYIQSVKKSLEESAQTGKRTSEI